jgi:hypothetical protein
MANEIFEPEQAWRFCDVCDPQNTRPFSAERAYIKHQTSQGHLKKTGQPLQDVVCPKCGKSLSQESAVQRHLTSGQCPRHRPTLPTIPESSRKHALSVSPNGIAWKIQKSAASEFSAGGTSLHTSASPDMGNSSRSLHQPIPPHPWSDNVASSSSQLSEYSAGSTDPHDNIDEILTPKLLRVTPVEASPDNQTPEPDLIPPNRQDRTDDTNDSNNELPVVHEERRPSSPQPNETPMMPIATSTSSSNQGEETDQWLSAAMESASLKDDNLAYPQVQGFLSSTPATSMSSWGSLFLTRSPRIAVLGWSLSPLAKASPHNWSSVRSAEMPAPMLTGPVDEELQMSRSTEDPSTSAPIRIPGLRNRNENPTKHTYQDRRWGAEIDFLEETDIDYKLWARKPPMALMLAIVQRQQKVMYKLFKEAFARDKWPTLSILDDKYCDMISNLARNADFSRQLNDNGNTILTLAKNAKFSHKLNQLLRLFVAVACCECSESTRRSSICSRLAHEGHLEEDELRSTDAGCRWGRKLRHQAWPYYSEKERDLEETRAETALEEIDARIEELKACWITCSDFRAQRQRMFSEWVNCEIFFF